MSLLRIFTCFAFVLLSLPVSASSLREQTACGQNAVAGELIAEMRMGDGSVRQYFRTPESIKSMNADFIAAMTAQKVPMAEIMKSPYATAKGATALCGGTKDCGTKKCTSGSCYYSNIGMAGCRC